MIDRFNVLFDRWIPVWTGDRRTLVSLEDVLCGAVESSADVVHSRDELRVFTHGLMSALVQALFEPADSSALERRLDEPMSREEYSARAKSVSEDFELLGEPGWMQWGERTDEDVTADLLHEFSETYRPALCRNVMAEGGLCVSCATAALYGFQAWAPAGGRGISPGVRGSPPLTTLVRGANLRQTTWANVYVTRGAYERYAKDDARPWALGPERRSKDGKSWEQYRKPASEIGLVEGLFWKPRAVRLAPAEDGECAVCAVFAPRVRVCAFRAGAKKEDGYFAHPWTPSRTDKGERRTQHVATDKPVWTGLADMLSLVRPGSSKSAEAGGEATLAAPTVTQWSWLNRPEGLSLLVFAYRFDNASMEGRFFQSFPAIKRWATTDFVNGARSAVSYAEEVLNALLYALRRAYSDRQKSTASYFPHDAQQQFWRETEPVFWRYVRALDSEDGLPSPIVPELASIARGIFFALTEPAALEAKHQQLVVRAQQGLNRALRAVADKESPRAKSASAERSETGAER